MKIALFDSGLGGLSVLSPLLKNAEMLSIPLEVDYLGDLAHLPYGTKSADEIHRLSRQGLEYLHDLNTESSKDYSHMIIACHTASAIATHALQMDFKERAPDTHIIGMLDATIELALAQVAKVKLQPSRVVVLGTQATIYRSAHKSALVKKGFEGVVLEKACPLFVPLVEEGLLEGEITEKVIDFYLSDLLEDADVVILGCTHYPFLKKSLLKLYPQVSFVDPGEALAEALLSNMNPHQQQSPNATPTLRFHFSDRTVDREKIEFLLNLLLGTRICPCLSLDFAADIK